MTDRSPYSPASLGRFFSLAGIALGAVGYVSTGVSSRAPVVKSAADSLPTATIVDGVSNLPNLVTVVPFYHTDHETSVQQTNVAIMAEVDGLKGLFTLDLGSPPLCMNRTFLQPRPGGGVDTVTPANRLPEHGWDSVHVREFRIGTLSLTPVDPAMPADDPRHPNALLTHKWNNFTIGFSPRLGNIGLSVLEPFETIIDYTKQQVVLIRLDSAGHRLANVPAYTPVWSAPLVDLWFHAYAKSRHYENMRFWGVRVLLGDSIQDSVFFDTGAPSNALRDTVRRMLQPRTRRWEQGGHMRNGELDHLIIAGRSFDNVSFGGDATSGNMLGFPFLSNLGVVGFNHRAHQFILYR